MHATYRCWPCFLHNGKEKTFVIFPITIVYFFANQRFSDVTGTKTEQLHLGSLVFVYSLIQGHMYLPDQEWDRDRDIRHKGKRDKDRDIRN